jgi:hypothetical protein
MGMDRRNCDIGRSGSVIAGDPTTQRLLEHWRRFEFTGQRPGGATSH